MGNSAQQPTPTQTTQQANTANLSTNAGDPPKEGNKPPCKACCACPETKQARDKCIMEKGEENCRDLIEAHKKCMRDMGFNI